MNEGEGHIILFDGVCNLCNGAVRFVIKRDPAGKFKFASLQSEEGQALMRQYGLITNELNSFIYIGNGRCYLRSSAALQVLKELGGTWKLAYGFMIIPRPFRDLIYNIIARTRYRIFGRRQSCMVPTPDLKERFLE